MSGKKGRSRAIPGSQGGGLIVAVYDSTCEVPRRMQLYDEMVAALKEWDKEAFLNVLQSGLSRGLSALEIAREELRPLSKEISERFQQNDIIFPEFLLMSDAIQTGFQFLLPLIKESTIKQNNPEKVVLGVIEGDIHDIGKNIVKVALEVEGFEVIDLGCDVPVHKFVEAARENGARIIASSSLMTPTLTKMQELENELGRAGLKGKIKTIIGGEATSREFAEKIGADAWGREAVEGVEKVKELVVQMKRGA